MKKKIVTLALAIIMVVLNFSNTFSAGKFSDIQDSDWFNATVMKLVSLNIINGYPDGTFKPDGNIAVDEFIKSTVTALKYSFENGKDYWATPYINKAKELGLVKDGEFADYTRAITRAEMARIIVRALNEKYADNIDAYTSKLIDYDSISPNMKEYVLKAFVKGIVTGYEDKTFKPDNNATRAEASTIIIRMIDKVKRVIPILAISTPIPTPKPLTSPKPTPVLLKINLSDDPTFEKLAEIDGFSGASGYDAPAYNFLYGEINPNNRGIMDSVLGVDYFKSDSMPTVANFQVEKYSESNMERFKKVLEIVLPEYKDELFDLALNYMGGKDDTYYGPLGEYICYIGPSNYMVYPKEERGVYIAVLRKK